ncbi:TRAP transporter large permease [Chloroflexota bacterium]
MSLTTIILIGVAIFLILMFLRMPIGLAMALVGFIGIAMVRGLTAALSNVGGIAYTTAISYHLSVIPLFILMGVLAGYGGVSKGAFSALHKWVGHLRGGLAMATTGACAAFGAVCGDHIATAATMCSAALPEMRRYKYSDELSLGCIASGGNLGFLIPPSAAFIVYGFVTQVSVGQLFMAGILPGLLLTLLFWVAIYIQCRVNPKLALPGPKVGWVERLVSLKDIWGIFLLFVVVMGGIYAGFFTPTEAGAVGAAATFLLGLASRQLTWKKFVDALLETVKTTALIFLLIIGAMIFSTFLTITEITITLANFIEGWQVNPYIILATILIFYVITGFFMDIFALLIVSLPIVFPIVVTTLGFDPVYFGVLAVLTIVMGSISPPVGVVVFAVHGIVRDVPLFTIFRGCLPFLAAMFVCLIILTAFPEISLLIPNLMMPYR